LNFPWSYNRDLMKNFRKKPHRSLYLRPQNKRHSNPAGNVLIYVVVVMLIFGVLGVVMVSLFTSSMASSVTRNDTRRAIYMAESGMRYAFSELRKADFDQDFILNNLSAKPYNVTDAGSFEIKILNTWFFPAAFGTNQVTLSAPVVTIPPDFTPPAGVYVVNFHSVDPNFSPDGAKAQTAGVESQSDNTMLLNLAIGDNFIANSHEQICFAVLPVNDPPLNRLEAGDDLDVALVAQKFFPRWNGAISIYHRDYSYDERIDDPDNNKVTLTNLSALSTGEFPINNVDTSTFVVLSPSNYLVAPEGKSDNVIYGGTFNFSKNIFNPVYSPGLYTPDISKFTSESVRSTPGFITVDTGTNTISIGRGISGGGGAAFGSVFFDADMSVGGDPNYCEQGACNFFLGIRAFFLVNFVNQGDGITFTLTSGPPQNSATSVGGDFQLSELMGYAGDSRLNANGTAFLATDAADHGLDPPKIAVEFDTRTNNKLGDPPPDYCADPSTANTDSRNDPLTNNKDAVQYVFWGRTSFLNIPCRNDNPLYDDNRHDADGEEPTEEWRFGMGGAASAWYPAIGSDGTIYTSDQVSNLYAFNQDGTLKWTFDLTDGNDYMPGIDRTGGPNDGTIYSDIYGSSVVAINPDGSQKWRFHISPSSDVDSTPTVGPDGVIYFGTDEAHALIALNPNGTERWRFPTGDEVDNVAALSPDGTTVYFVSNDSTLYALKQAARLADPTGVGGINVAQGEWIFPILTEPNEINSSPTVNPADGTIYVGSDDHKVYALNPTARAAGLAFPQAGEWAFTTGGEVEPSPAIDDHGTPGDKSDDTIYIGSDDHYFYAIRANGTQKWRYQTNAEIVSSAIVDLDRTVYVGSDDGRVYAFNPNGTLKWFFATGAPVQSSPALGQAGFIHIGSNDTNIYTISQFADPRNFKDEDKSSGKLLTVEDLSSGTEVVEVNSTDDWLNGKPGVKGPFAVRLEVDRSLTPNADGEFNYELRLWMRQCNNDLLCDNILGTFFQDTRLKYDYSAVPASLPMIQRFALNAAEQAAFNKFFFGFTGAAGAEALEATISQFQLSFIRSGDPVITNDSLNWPP
jgi:outer membrane protein assembly factor BamB/type II secretory pathway pseudopilin PulG